VEAKFAATRDGPLKNWCFQILGPDQAGLGYRKIRKPFDNHSFLMALAATFGGHINLATNQIVHMPVVTFEALAFTALAVGGELLVVVGLGYTIEC